MTVGIAICAHESRTVFAEELSAELDCPVVMDHGHMGSLKNHDAAWLAAVDQGAEWSLVLEDDVILSPNFIADVAAAIRHVPDRDSVISLYTGTGKPYPAHVSKSVEEAEAAGSSWLRGDRLLWGPAVLMPTDMVDDMLETVRDSLKPYDQRLSGWQMRRKLPVFYTLPSLVQHRDGDSLITKPNTVRKAQRFGYSPTWGGESPLITG